MAFLISLLSACESRVEMKIDRDFAAGTFGLPRPAFIFCGTSLLRSQAMKIAENLLEPGKPVGIWIRVSTEDQAQGDSPQHHEARARHYAAAKEWAVKEIYNLAGVSGKSVIAHPETTRMLTDIRSGRISALFFSKLARLTRNARELMDFAEIFWDHNADLVSLQENIDTGTPSGRLFYNMVAVMAQWEPVPVPEPIGVRPMRAAGVPAPGENGFLIRSMYT